MIRKFCLAYFTLRSAVFFAAAVLLAAADPALGLTVDKVLATVNNEVITLSDYLRFVKNIGGKEEVDEAVLKKLIEQRIILLEAKKRGIAVNEAEADKLLDDFRREHSLSKEDLERELEKEGLTMQGYREMMKEDLAASKLIEEEVDSKVAVSGKELEAFYEANRGDYLSSPVRIELKAVFLRLDPDATVTEVTDLKRKVLRITAQLRDADDFDAVAFRYNEDYLKNQESRLGEFAKGALIPQLDERAFSMKIGEISEPIWVRDGVYILKLAGKSEEVFKPLGEVKEDIHRRLISRKREMLLNEWMKALWERASVTIN